MCDGRGRLQTTSSVSRPPPCSQRHLQGRVKGTEVCHLQAEPCFLGLIIHWCRFWPYRKLLASAWTQRCMLNCDISHLNVCVCVADCPEVTPELLRHLSSLTGLKRLTLTGEQASLTSGQEDPGSWIRDLPDSLATLCIRGELRRHTHCPYQPCLDRANGNQTTPDWPSRKHCLTTGPLVRVERAKRHLSPAHRDSFRTR